MLIIDDLIALPAKGFMGIVQKIHDLVMEELEDSPEKLKRELLDLQMRFAAEEIREEEYMNKEKDILIRLENLTK